MKEFLSRLKESCLSVIGFIVALIGMLIFILLTTALIVLLPIWLLKFLIGDYALWWFVIVFIGLPILGEWDNVKDWFIWQFVEPFRKNK